MAVKANRRECLRCGGVWAAKKKINRRCPICTSPYWDKPRLAKELVCKRCGHEWAYNDHDKKTPLRCPSCLSVKWEDEKNRKHLCSWCGCSWVSKEGRERLCLKCYKPIRKNPGTTGKHVNVGKNNPQWKGGIAEYKNHSLLKRNRLIVLKKTNYVCQECGGKATQTHHKNKRKDQHHLSNLIALCHKCHMGIFHKGRKMKPYRFGFDLKEIASEVGCSSFTVYCHLSKKRNSKAFGVAIDQAIKQRKESNGNQNKQIGL